MNATISGIKIRGICAAVPSAIYKFEDELKNFPFSEKSSRRLARVMGFNEHRITDKGTTPCDLASYIIDYMEYKRYISKKCVKAYIVVAQMADHPVPGNSKVIHGQCLFQHDVFCLDIYENCIGFITGLYIASGILKNSSFDEILLITTDAGSCYANKSDRNIYPLCGDAAAVTVLKKTDNQDDILHFAFKFQGENRDALITPAGGMRLPHSAETAKIFKDKMGNFRCLDNLHMDGTAVFQFVMKEVPPLIDELCNYAQIDKKSIDYYLSHQPNRFMLQKLSQLINVPQEKFFNNIVEHFGNSSCVTIPLNIVYNLNNIIKEDSFSVCYSAFGAGLSLASCLDTLGPLDFCDLIEHPGNGSTIYKPKEV
ncbi:MAG: hypothetical protein IKN64_07855 [Desulfovibrio sp.]|nr:hypothetical protein [Desulfovibrio sp.]